MPEPHTPHTPLSRELTLALIGRIEKGEFHPGDKLPGEQTLAREFGVSRGIVRESLKSLAILDVLESRHGSGTYLSARAAAGIANWRLYHSMGENADLACLLDTRLIVEPPLAAAAAQRASAEEIANIFSFVRVYGAQDAPPSDKEGLLAAVNLSRGFHQSVARAAHNPLLARLVETVAARLYSGDYIESYRRLTASEMKNQFNEHARIAERIAAGDAPGASRAMERHLKRRQSLVTGA